MNKNKLKSAQKKYNEVKSKQIGIAEETKRVANVLENINSKIDDLDEEFTNKTGITNKEDMTFLFIAIFLQCTRWALMPKMDTDFSKVPDSERLASNTTQKEGIYAGEKSGKTYEMKKINEIKGKNIVKYDKDKGLYQNFLNGEGEYEHISWLEILFRPVPYDAMNAIDDTKIIIPRIRNLSNAGVNINGVNHHVATLGHDPILGWIFGTMNILSRRITFINLMTFNVILESPQLDKWRQYIDYKPNTNILDMINYCVGSVKEDAKRLPAAVARQAMHLQSDKLTKEGLPIPFLSSLNPEKAQNLIKNGWNSNEVERLISKVAKDAAIVGIQAITCMMINLIIKAIYLFCAEEDNKEYLDLREVKIRKILMLSNVIASSSNILYVAFSKNIGKLDIGGMGITLFNLFNDRKLIKQIKYEFISNGLEKEIMGNENWEDNYYWEVK
ncbi:hypothetical protein [[Clostridium] fimetarium]|uniref:Uncharacterized protein n=1 Tax=[Clostridium] fimetarium TaxID=99656 RepID=A0A1I0NFC3_9FIRM|nr:hypothetical protein [[Clostridium] fimetarium]SEW00049.1 hypothetical protein SAMN05421659_10362 [[Clostridium] fimetarium]